ncbi:transposase [Streptomyces sp. NPDC048362]|uniref:transposase n=1 Tax=Streptomyces sp. NPDC048362 TaxID=3365539 RepID=UPI00371B728B
MRRALAAVDEKVLAKVAKVRAKVHRQVWSQIALRPGGFPWLSVAGKILTGWIVVDIDVTIITSASKKQGAAATFKKTFGFHPLAAWCANTQESLAMLLREGNAGSNTVADHLAVLADALAQTPGSSRAKILVRIDGAGATHDLLKRLEALNTKRVPCATWSAGRSRTRTSRPSRCCPSRCGATPWPRTAPRWPPRTSPSSPT